MKTFKDFLRRKQAVEYLQAQHGFGSLSALAAYARYGGGPLFRMNGKIPLYDPQDLDAWVLGRLSEPLEKRPDSPDGKRSRAGRPKRSAAQEEQSALSA